MQRWSMSLRWTVLVAPFCHKHTKDHRAAVTILFELPTTPLGECRTLRLHSLVLRSKVLAVPQALSRPRRTTLLDVYKRTLMQMVAQLRTRTRVARRAHST